MTIDNYGSNMMMI